MRKMITISTIAFTILSQPGWTYQVNDGKIADKNNNIVVIDGVNWAGFQDNNFVDELYGAIPFYPLAKPYQPPISLGVINLLKDPEKFSSDTNVTNLNSVSFKTIRLPINPANLHDARPNNHFRINLTDTKNPDNGNGVFCKLWGENECSQPLSVSESLFKIVEEFKKNEIRVLIDFHQTPSGRTGNVVADQYQLDDYKNDIAELAINIKEKHLDNVIGIDVFNEPHRLNWFTQNGNQPAWVDVIAAAAQAIHEHNPDLLLFVEGPSSEENGPTICIANGKIPANDDAYTINANACGNGLDAISFKSNWGENFKPLLDAEAAKQGEFKLGNQLRTELSKRLPENTVNWLLGQVGDSTHKGAHIVFSPHIYGKHVASWQSTPIGSPIRFNWNFGFIQDAHYPVVIGESGYLPNQQTDVDFFHQSIIPYLKSKHINHQLFYWTFNTNSGDTGGIRENANTAALIVEKEQTLHDLFYSDNN